MDKIKVGVKGMDELLGGGLPKGRTILVSGSCGTGKTIFASQFAQESIKNKVPCVYVTFESKRKLTEDMKELGIDFEKMESTGLFRLVGGSIGSVKRFKEKTRAGILDIANEVEEVMREINAKRFVLDSVNLFSILFENNVERRKALTALTSRLDQLECTSLLTCEVREGTRDISWYGFEEFVVDGVIVLFRIPFENMYERSVNVIKMRGVDHSKNVCSIRINGKGVVVYPHKEPFHKLGRRGCASPRRT